MIQDEDDDLVSDYFSIPKFNKLIQDWKKYFESGPCKTLPNYLEFFPPIFIPIVKEYWLHKCFFVQLNKKKSNILSIALFPPITGSNFDVLLKIIVRKIIVFRVSNKSFAPLNMNEKMNELIESEILEAMKSDQKIIEKKKAMNCASMRILGGLNQQTQPTFENSDLFQAFLNWI